MPDQFINVGGVGVRVEQDGGLITLPHDHEKSHLGQMFYFDNFGTIGNGGTLSWLVTCGTVYNIHATFELAVSGAFQFYMYDKSAGSAGTAITVWNTNRDRTVTFHGRLRFFSAKRCASE